MYINYTADSGFGRRHATLGPRLFSWIRLSSAGFLAICLFWSGPLVGSRAAAALPAFPGAEGAGALAAGGRGGIVCKVTNLNDSGPGSLRACVEMSGPRTVIFDVGGTIELKHHLWIRNPYLTIAGQTAPGGGIQLRAAPGMDRPLISVSTNDVIIRFLRLRRGYTGFDGSNISITDTASQVVRNLMFDHLSMSWSEYKNWDVWARSASTAPRNITLQNSIAVEVLSDRPNINTGGANSSSATASANIDFHNNLMGHSRHRNPLLKHGSGRFVNNIVYNWTYWASRTSGGVYGDFISNLYKPGPSEKTSSSSKFELVFVGWEGHSIESRPNRDPSLHVTGNRGFMSGMSPNTDNWMYTRRADGSDNADVGGSAPAAWRRNTPLDVVGVPISSRHVDELENYLLPVVGASKRLDCNGNWIENRDTVDNRIIGDYQQNRGGLVSRESQVGGHPVLNVGTPCRDTSGDGVPDAWASANGLDPTDPSLGRRFHSSGYTYLELYLNGTQIGGAPAPEAPAQILVQ
jgi:pectate lyase